MAEREFTARLASLEIPAADPGGLAAFYEDVFGWPAGPPAASGRWRPLEVPDAAGEGLTAALTTPEELGADQPVAVIDVAGAPLETVLAAVVAGGGEVERPARAVGQHGRFALFRDPAGNLLGLWAALGDRSNPGFGGDRAGNAG